MKRSRKGEQQELAFNVDETIGPPKKKAKQEQQVYLEEGVRLDEKEKMYLLPHFTMMLVGKPGSGKTSVIRQLLNDPAFYYKKFENVILISPSATKMEINVKKENLNQEFSLKWIEDRLFEINEKQEKVIIQRLRDLQIIDKFDTEKLNGKLLDEIRSNKLSKEELKAEANDPKERFFTNSTLKRSAIQAQPSQKISKKLAGRKDKNGNAQSRGDLAKYVDETYQKYVVKLPIEERNQLYTNCLVVLDDMVSQIKANEFDPLLTQLFFNRRHLIINGMVSVVVVSQKYTMIPARIRSNANWLVLFRLNPVDFENVYKDVIMMGHTDWEQLVEYVFGERDQESQQTKKYNNLGIWVEQDQFFLNFHKMNISVKGQMVDDWYQQQVNQ